VLGRCLERDKTNRYRDIGDVRLDLSGVSSDLAGSESDTSGGVKIVPMLVLMVLIATIAGLAGSFVGGNRASQDGEAREALHVGIAVGPMKDPGEFGNFAISPDGRYIAYAGYELGEDPDTGTSRVHLIDMKTGERRSLEGTQDASHVSFSPSGEQIAFSYLPQGPGRQEVRRMDVDGGPAQIAYIDPDGRQYFINQQVWLSEQELLAWGQQEDALYRVDVRTQAITKICDIDNASEWFGTEPIGMLDENLLMVNRYRPVEAGLTADVFVVDLESQQMSLMLENVGVPYYIESGYLLFVRDESLCIAPFDRETRTMTGDITPLVNNLHGPSTFAISPRGDLLMAVRYNPDGQQDQNLGRLMVVDTSGQQRPLVDATRQFEGRISISPDATMIAISEFGSSPPKALVVNIENGFIQPAYPSAQISVAEGWMPDGRMIVNYVHTPGHYVLQAVDLTGLRPPEDLLIEEDSLGQQRASTVSDDGELLALQYAPNESTREQGVYMVDLRVDLDERVAVPLDATAMASEGSPMFSPDGLWLAYTTDASGMVQVVVRAINRNDLGATTRVYRVSQQGGHQPLWAPDGSAIYFRDLQGNLMRSSITYQEDGLTPGVPSLVLEERDIKDSVTWGAHSYAIMPDGEHFVYLSRENSGDEIHTLELKLNWLPEVIKGLESEKSSN
jgi:Tol biopolymer transport system component